ncbi:hypothetical protein H2204_012303 [Knufia peltigerae]|uniref:Uncharacterized protein n=1 Tax=Knufia peltigerae TaxID=1002370 RepID=A0AA38XSL0_9EURO|nr:hypothetical protein H2204_012303 [Knufia peltigerae]
MRHETSNRLKRIQDSLELNSAEISAEIRKSQDNIRQDIQRLEETIKFQGAESDVSDKAVHSDSDRTDSGAMKTFHLRRRDRLHGFMSSTPAVNDNSLDGENLSREVKLPSMKFVWTVDVLVPNGRRSRDVSAGVDPDLKFSWTDNSFVFSKLKASDQIKRIQDVEDDSFYKGKSQSMFKLRYKKNYYEPEGVVRLWISRHRHFDRVPIDFLVFDSLAPPGEVGLVICSDQLRLTSDAQQSGPATKTSSSYNLNSPGESAQARPSNTRRPSGNLPGTPSTTSASNQHQPPVAQSQSYARDSRSAPSTSTRPQNQQSDAQRYSSAGSRRDLPTTPTRTQNQQADPQRHPADSAASRRSIPTTSTRPQNRQPDPQRQPDRFRSNVPSASSTPRQNRQPEKQKHPVRGGYRDNHSSSSTDSESQSTDSEERSDSRRASRRPSTTHSQRQKDKRYR